VNGFKLFAESKSRTVRNSMANLPPGIHY
jgi:hypothetical protein